MKERPNHMLAGWLFVGGCIFVAIAIYVGIKVGRSADIAVANVQPEAVANTMAVADEPVPVNAAAPAANPQPDVAVSGCGKYYVFASDTYPEERWFSVKIDNDRFNFPSGDDMSVSDQVASTAADNAQFQIGLAEFSLICSAEKTKFTISADGSSPTVNVEPYEKDVNGHIVDHIDTD